MSQHDPEFATIVVCEHDEAIPEPPESATTLATEAP
jgi:hypothetical protein